MIIFENTREFAKNLDSQDPLAKYKEEFNETLERQNRQDTVITNLNKLTLMKL